MGRLMFKRKFRLEMIDANEREIERRKSFNRNFKEQIKAINREINVEYRKANVSPAIPLAA
jgi:hypothetical protein